MMKFKKIITLTLALSSLMAMAFSTIVQADQTKEELMGSIIGACPTNGGLANDAFTETDVNVACAVEGSKLAYGGIRKKSIFNKDRKVMRISSNPSLVPLVGGYVYYNPLFCADKVPRGFVAEKIVDGSKIGIFSFRGSVDGNDWWQNLKALIPEKFNAFGQVLKCHRGVEQRFKEMFPQLVRALDDLLQDGVREFIFTGHSLGGGLATRAAIAVKDLHQHDDLKVKLITFSGMAIFSNRERAMAEVVAQEIGNDNIWRFDTEGDPVPNLGAGGLSKVRVGTNECSTSIINQKAGKSAHNLELHLCNLALYWAQKYDNSGLKRSTRTRNAGWGKLSDPSLLEWTQPKKLHESSWHPGMQSALTYATNDMFAGIPSQSAKDKAGLARLNRARWLIEHS